MLQAQAGQQEDARHRAGRARRRDERGGVPRRPGAERGERDHRQGTRATYALLVSLLPATATVIGIVVLSQVPSTREVLGVLLVIAGVALHRSR